MSLTLWHRDRLLGSLFIRPASHHQLPRRPDKGPTINAVLLPADAIGPDAGVWQFRVPFPDLAEPRYNHIPVEPDIVAERHIRSASPSNQGCVALHPITEEERQRIRPIPELSIRDGEGRQYVPRQLRLEEMRMETEPFHDVLRDIPRETLIEQSIWCVFAAFDLGVDAPAT